MKTPTQIEVTDGSVLKLETVKLDLGDIGFRAVFMHNGDYHLIAKVLPFGMGKPKDKEGALKLLQQLVSLRPDLVVKYTPGMRIKYES